MVTHRLRILRNASGITEAALLDALSKGTDLPVDIATSLARAVVAPPAHIDWVDDSGFPAEQVAGVLVEQGFEVSFDA